MMHLSAINVYPIKSARGIPLSRAALDEFGLRHDRRWMLVDDGGRFVSQRECHRLALVSVQLAEDVLLLRAPGMDELPVEPVSDQVEQFPVRIWGDICMAQNCGTSSAEWFTRFLGFSTRLVYMPQSTFRRTNPDFVRENRKVSFADAYPVLLTGESSLAELNGRLPSPLPMNRFRPNLVVSGALPFAEDGWKTIHIGALQFDVVKPCDRCVTTTIDQLTGEQGTEPLRTLAQFRKWNGQVYFGQNLVHLASGTLAVGDPVLPWPA